ncbi:MAG: alkaline phosphatase family protein [Anaerolineae bacterium]|nr:alkaline phosphatase family protein [Anaerolineae bacterium]
MSLNNRSSQKRIPPALKLLVGLVVLVLGYLNFALFSTMSEVSQNELASSAADLAAPVEQVDLVTAAIPEEPAANEILVRWDDAEPTPPLPLPTATAKPTATPTQVVSAWPTATETAQPTPTVTALPSPTVPVAAELPALAEPITATVEGPAPSGKIEHVVIISIDGLRPDALFLAVTPNLDRLIAGGTYCPQAQTVDPSITLVSHASMLTGMLPEKHGIVWGMPYIGWPGMTGPTLFNVAHDAGLSTAMVFGKHKLHYLVLPNSVDTIYGEDMHDPDVRDRALEIIEAGLPNALFLHFPDNDRVGHAYGWMSENQFYAITYVDGLVGEIVAALEAGGYLPNTLLIVTADHGGHGKSHGDDSPLDRTIPWLAYGPGVPAGLTLNRAINTYDTAATTLHALDLPLPENWDGQPVLEIFE